MTDRELVLLHGALGSSVQLEELAVALDSPFRVHLLDFEGHGNALPQERPFRIEHFAENVIELLERERIGPAHLFGYSMGGYVALHLASAHPERVRRIATLGTRFEWDPATAARVAARLDPDTIRARVPNFAEALATRHAAQEGGWEGVVFGTASCLKALGDKPLLAAEVLAGISHPVRVIVGDADDTVTIEESERAARALPNGELVVLPNTPHPLERVDLALLVPALREFFVAGD